MLILLTASFVCGAPLQGGNDCTSPSPVGLGTVAYDTTAATTSGFAGSAPCDDGILAPHRDLFWTFTAPTGGHYRFSTVGSSFDTVLGVFRGSGCAATCVERNDNAHFLQSVVDVVGVAPGETFVVQVGGYASPFPSSQPEFGVGLLTIETFEDPCLGHFFPDYLEENDNCHDALPLGDGFYPGLEVSGVDPDFYRVEVAPGGVLVVDLFDADPTADLVLTLWDDVGSCAGGDPNDALVRSANNNYTGTYDEWITYVHPGPGPATYLLEVESSALSDCSDYDLQIAGTTGGAHALPVGQRNCESTVNSTGRVGQLIALGSSAVADGDLSLAARSLPPGRAGLFFVAPAAGYTPNFGGDGVLCVAGPIGRFLGPGMFQVSNPRGEIDVAVDLGQLPRPAGFVAVAPGDQWHFQLWMRDWTLAGPTTNLTNSVTIDFQ